LDGAIIAVNCRAAPAKMAGEHLAQLGRKALMM
jgi:hypothetical protein